MFLKLPSLDLGGLGGYSVRADLGRAIGDLVGRSTLER
jgi:hypothetical protein